jgi:hypothetical protein
MASHSTLARGRPLLRRTRTGIHCDQDRRRAHGDDPRNQPFPRPLGEPHRSVQARAGSRDSYRTVPRKRGPPTRLREITTHHTIFRRPGWITGPWGTTIGTARFRRVVVDRVSGHLAGPLTQRR